METRISIMLEQIAKNTKGMVRGKSSIRGSERKGIVATGRKDCRRQAVGKAAYPEAADAGGGFEVTLRSVQRWQVDEEETTDGEEDSEVSGGLGCHH